jgi:hypothetical protein
MGGAKRRATQRAEIRDIAKEFRLVAQRVKREFARGMLDRDCNRAWRGLVLLLLCRRRTRALDLPQGRKLHRSDGLRDGFHQPRA